MLINIAKDYKMRTFVTANHYNGFVYIALDSISTNNNTPFLPLNNAH